MGRTGVLIVCTGGPATFDAVPAFLEASRGRAPSGEELQAAVRMYLSIGGVSPAPAVAERVAAALERRLNGLPAERVESDPTNTVAALDAGSGRAPGPVELPVLVGMRAAHPTFAETLELFASIGVTRVVALSVSPLEEPLAAALNAATLDLAASRAGIEVVRAGDFLDSDTMTGFMSHAHGQVIAEMRSEHRPVIVFTAAAVPAAEALAGGYVERVETAAIRVADALGLGAVDAAGLESTLGVRALGGPGPVSPWLVAYQSAVPVADANGPDLRAVIDAAAAHGFTAVCVLPIGFAMDDVETMWTIDVLAADAALERGMEFARAVAANDDPQVIEAMEDAIRRVL